MTIRFWAVALAAAALLMPACGSTANVTGAGTGSVTVTDLQIGTGAIAVTGDTLTVHYVGSFDNGTTFDSSYGGAPFTFQLGAGRVIAGWDMGLPGMRVGGKRRLVIPSGLAYGSQGNGPIPPNATLHFDVELLAIAGK
jgi:FKBP-type peptidyl-prolyl cis-trans isomerase